MLDQYYYLNPYHRSDARRLHMISFPVSNPGYSDELTAGEERMGSPRHNKNGESFANTIAQCAAPLFPFWSTAQPVPRRDALSADNAAITTQRTDQRRDRRQRRG